MRGTGVTEVRLAPSSCFSQTSRFCVLENSIALKAKHPPGAQGSGSIFYLSFQKRGWPRVGAKGAACGCRNRTWHGNAAGEAGPGSPLLSSSSRAALRFDRRVKHQYPRVKQDENAFSA